MFKCATTSLENSYTTTSAMQPVPTLKLPASFLHPACCAHLRPAGLAGVARVRERNRVAVAEEADEAAKRIRLHAVVNAHHWVPSQCPAACGSPHVAEAYGGFEGQAVQCSPRRPGGVSKQKLRG
jgi:hypothetical protein